MGNVIFLSALPADSQDTAKGKDKSDLCAVGYFLGYDSPNLNNPRKSMNLYRFFRGSDDTFKILRSDEALTTGGGKAISTAPSGEEVLARNVVDFKITGYLVDTATGKTTIFDPTANVGKTPSFIDIELTALNNEAAKRLDTEDQWLNKTSATYKKAARTFSTRVNLSAAQPQQ